MPKKGMLEKIIDIITYKPITDALKTDVERANKGLEEKVDHLSSTQHNTQSHLAMNEAYNLLTNNEKIFARKEADKKAANKVLLPMTAIAPVYFAAIYGAYKLLGLGPVPIISDHMPSYDTHSCISGLFIWAAAAVYGFLTLASYGNKKNLYYNEALQNLVNTQTERIKIHEKFAVASCK